MANSNAPMKTTPRSATTSNSKPRTRRKKMKISFIKSLALIFGLAVTGMSPTSQAANTADTYTGSVTGNVTTGSNWSLGTAPVVTNDAVFNNGTGIRNFGG